MKLSDIPDSPAADQSPRLKLSQAPADKSSPEGEGPSLWDSLKTFASKSVSDLARGGREIAQGAGELASDAGQALMPGRGGVDAGGRVLNKLGDVAQFASGGLAGPLGMPRPPGAGAPAQLGRGLDVQARAAQVPQPQLALPPPQMGVPGRPAVSTGQGMMPPGPGAVMTAPEATPAAGAAAKPAAPLVPPGLERGEPSTFASAIAANDPSAIDRSLVKQYRGAVRPGKSNMPMKVQDQKITTAVDTIIDHKNSIQFDGEMAGSKLPPGQLPRTLDQFAQGIDHLEGEIYQQYTNLAKQAGGQGAQVPLAPAVNKLQELLAEPKVSGVAANRGLVREMQRQIESWSQQGAYSPLEMQNLVQGLNKQLKGGIQTAESSTRNAVMGPVLGVLRETLNNTMQTALQGPQYQNLRNQLSSIDTIRSDVANAVQRQANKAAPAPVREILSHTPTAALLGYATFSHDLKYLGTAAAVEAGRYMSRYLKSPNRAVTAMFNRRSSALSPSYTDRMSATAATKLGELRQDYYDANRRRDLDTMRDLNSKMADYR